MHVMVEYWVRQFRCTDITSIPYLIRSPAEHLTAQRQDSGEFAWSDLGRPKDSIEDKHGKGDGGHK